MSNGSFVIGGIYRHYKGNEYVVIGIALHTEFNEQTVIYRSMDGKLYARPLSMWFETVNVTEAGGTQRRFEFTGRYTESAVRLSHVCLSDERLM